MSKLIPDPPLSNFPALPDGFRWLIEPRNEWAIRNGYKDVRRVYIQESTTVKTLLRRENTVWSDLTWSVWDVKKGLGDLSMVGKTKGYNLKGLASAMQHAMEQMKEQLGDRESPPNPYLDIHGVSVL